MKKAAVGSLHPCTLWAYPVADMYDEIVAGLKLLLVCMVSVLTKNEIKRSKFDMLTGRSGFRV